MSISLSFEMLHMLPAAFDVIPLLGGISRNKKPLFFREKQIIFSDGGRSDSIFYVDKGMVKIRIPSAKGKEALIGLLDGGDFLGESCRATKYKELESD